MANSIILAVIFAINPPFAPSEPATTLRSVASSARASSSITSGPLTSSAPLSSGFPITSGPSFTSNASIPVPYIGFECLTNSDDPWHDERSCSCVSKAETFYATEATGTITTTVCHSTEGETYGLHYSSGCSLTTSTLLRHPWDAVEQGCCNYCKIEVPTVRIIFWEARTTDTNASYTAGNFTATRRQVPVSTLVEDGFTFTSPSVYIAYSGIHASQSCVARIGEQTYNEVGGTHDVTRAYSPESISSVICVNSIAVGGGAAPISWEPINYNDLANPIPLSESYSRVDRCFTDRKDNEVWGDWMKNPFISLPSDVSEFDPLWTTCSGVKIGAMDPPRGLVPASGWEDAPPPPDPTPDSGSGTDPVLPMPGAPVPVPVPAQTNPPKSDPPMPDPPADPPKDDPPKVDPPKAGPPKAGPPKADPPKHNPPKASSPKHNPPKADPPSGSSDPASVHNDPGNEGTTAYPGSHGPGHPVSGPKKVSEAGNSQNSHPGAVNNPPKPKPGAGSSSHPGSGAAHNNGDEGVNQPDDTDYTQPIADAIFGGSDSSPPAKSKGQSSGGAKGKAKAQGNSQSSSPSGGGTNSRPQGGSHKSGGYQGGNGEQNGKAPQSEGASGGDRQPNAGESTKDGDSPTVAQANGVSQAKGGSKGNGGHEGNGGPKGNGQGNGGPKGDGGLKGNGGGGGNGDPKGNKGSEANGGSSQPIYGGSSSASSSDTLTPQTHDSSSPNYPHKHPSSFSYASNAPPSIGSETVQRAPDGAAVIGTTTLHPGEAAVIQGTPVSRAPHAIIVGSSTYTLKPSPAPGKGAGAGQPEIVRAPDGGLVVGSQTIHPGHRATIHGHVVSVGGGNVVVDGQNYDFPAPTATPAEVGGLDIHAAGDGGGDVVAGQTFMPGMKATISGHVVSVGPDNKVMVDGSTITVVPTPTPGGAVLVNGEPIVRAPGGAGSGVIIGDVTLTPGTHTIIGGHDVRIAPRGGKVIVDGSTYGVPKKAGATVTEDAGAIATAGGSAAVYTVGNEIFTPAPTGFAIDGTSLYPGGPAITVSGTVVSLGTDGLRIGSSTVILTTATGGGDGLGGVIMSGFGGRGSAATTTTTQAGGETPLGTAGVGTGGPTETGTNDFEGGVGRARWEVWGTGLVSLVGLVALL
ncbi:MAG: hypothetical protein Q9167_003053 [Letrouitia subvulpina]